MLAIKIELLHGVLRASSHEDTANTGDPYAGEWPPSPARVFAALVSADGTGIRCRVTDGSELRSLELAPPPVIHASEIEIGESTLLNPRYVVSAAAAKGVVQNYPAKVSTLVRPGVRMSPRTPVVTYAWDVDLTAAQFEALRKRCARVGYIGCSDSPVRMTMTLRSATAESATAVSDTSWLPGSGKTFLPVPFDGFTDVLDLMYERFTHGEQVRRNQYPKELARYAAPSERETATRRVAQVIWLRFDRSIAGHRVRDVTETLRNAVLEHYERHVSGGRDSVPSILHGHADDDLRAQWLALPNVGYKYSDGRIHGAAIVLPAETVSDIVAGVETSVWHLTAQRLVKPGAFDVEVGRWGGERVPFASTPERWTRKSRRWSSAFPVVYETHARRGVTAAEVARWCEFGGLPRPIAFRVSNTPFISGGVTLRAHEARREGDRHPFSHMEIEFPEAIAGPVVLGRGRNFGIGLFAPVGGVLDD